MQIVKSSYVKTRFDQNRSLTGEGESKEMLGASVSRQGDSCTLSSASSYSGAVVFGALGTVPLIGMASNVALVSGAQYGDSSEAVASAQFGSLLNPIGSAVLLGGFVSGSNLAKQIGFGLLGLSGLAAAHAGFVSPPP